MKVTYLYPLIVFLLIGCSNTTDITTEPDLIDYRNKKIYRTVKIGSQVWMAENLDVATFRNGDLIQEVASEVEWIKTGETISPAWCYYANDQQNTGKYGRLYNSYAVNDPRGLAPVGWHIPSDSEWTVLSTYLGGELIAGGKIKETKGWNFPNISASNSSGFSAIPSGLRHFEGHFKDFGDIATWWSSTKSSSDSYWIRSANFNSEALTRVGHYGKRGIAVRCVKD